MSDEFWNEDDSSGGDFGFADNSDPTIPAKEFEQWPEGKTKIKGIYEFIDVEDNAPYYKPVGDRLLMRVKLMTEEGEEGPPMSFSAAEGALLVKAFGGKLSALPKRRDTPQYMMAVMEQVNSTGRVKEIYVNKDGWATFWSIEGTELPADRIFRFRLADMRSIKGGDVVAFEEDNFHRRVLNVFLEVVGGDQGEQTVFDGAKVRVQMEDPFDGTSEREGEDGVTRIVPNGKVAKNGGTPIAVIRMKQFLKCFWPDVRHYEYMTDATRSQFGVNEAEDPIKVIAHYALEENRIVKGVLTTNSKGNVVLDLRNLVPLSEQLSVPEPQAEGQTKPGPLPTMDENKRALRSTIDELCVAMAGVSAFTNEKGYILSDTGKVWCKENLVPLWNKHKDELPTGSRALGPLTDQQAEILLGEVLATFSSYLNQTAEQPTVAEEDWS